MCVLGYASISTETAVLSVSERAIHGEEFHLDCHVNQSNNSHMIHWYIVTAFGAKQIYYYDPISEFHGPLEEHDHLFGREVDAFQMTDDVYRLRVARADKVNDSSSYMCGFDSMGMSPATEMKIHCE